MMCNSCGSCGETLKAKTFNLRNKEIIVNVCEKCQNRQPNKYKKI